MITYRPRHFDLEELVDPVTWNLLGEKAWWLLDPRLLWTLDQIRARFDRRVIVNTWKWQTEKPFTLRGFRPSSAALGGFHSQHRYGRAADFDVEGVLADEVRADILSHQNDSAFQYITCLETDISWIHMDVRNWDRSKNGIFLVKP